MSKYLFFINKLFGVNFHTGMKLDLSNMHKINDLLNNPIASLKCIHVAGTNGKGSVTTKIAKALSVEGFSVGLFTSPHISSFRERIKINGMLIDEDRVINILERLFSLIEKEKIPATFFEITTFLAFLYFKEQNVDYIVLETGLGGRLDATNIVTPILSIITSISFEHTEFLGTTIEEITKEKAGIIKPSVPVVIGPNVPLKQLEEIAFNKSSPLMVVSEKFDYYNDENNAIAKKALEWMKISSTSIEEGLKELPPCRFEIVGNNPTIILDVAHNPDGLSSLFKTIKDKYPNQDLRIIFGLSKSKDISTCLKIIKQQATAFHLIESSNGRNIEKSLLKEFMLKEGFDKNSIFTNSTTSDTVNSAIQLATDQKQIIVVCGSFFIMGDIRASLNLNEPRDLFDMNER